MHKHWNSANAKREQADLHALTAAQVVLGLPSFEVIHRARLTGYTPRYWFNGRPVAVPRGRGDPTDLVWADSGDSIVLQHGPRPPVKVSWDHRVFGRSHMALLHLHKPGAPLDSWGPRVTFDSAYDAVAVHVWDSSGRLCHRSECCIDRANRGSFGESSVQCVGDDFMVVCWSFIEVDDEDVGNYFLEVFSPSFNRTTRVPLGEVNFEVYGQEASSTDDLLYVQTIDFQAVCRLDVFNRAAEHLWSADFGNVDILWPLSDGRLVNWSKVDPGLDIFHV
eukprot:TRINITY_DN846_c0_g1_i2.p1 TRINITY_DN846_c0_g1~~TRINITY_DN846_c0_g1_i2.p1  ORF type:complete len:278 (-),score=46.48 TRINITY_DN846_c0_g1_i2:48-881(-)